MIRIALVTLAILSTEVAHANDLSQRLREVAARRHATLLAEAGLLIPDVADDSDDALVAVSGPCVRPDATQRRALHERVVAWLAKQVRAKNERMRTPLIAFGCAPDGSVGVNVDVVRDDEDDVLNHLWWLRVGRSIEVVAHAADRHYRWISMPSKDGQDEEESGDVAAIFGAIDVDGDGRLEPIFAKSTLDTGEEIRAVLTWGKARVEFRGALMAAEWQPDPDYFVVRLLPKFEEERFRCIAAGRSGFVECAAAERVRVWARAHDTAREVMGRPHHWPDRVAVASMLQDIGVSPAEAAAVIALARPSTIAEILLDFFEQRQVRIAAMPDAQLAARDAAILARITKTLPDLPSAPCQVAAAAGPIERWIIREQAAYHDAHDLADEALGKLTRVTLGASCGAPHGALVLAEWERAGGVGRAVFHVAHGRAVPVVYTFAAGGVLGHEDTLRELRATFVRRGDSVVGVVSLDDDYSLIEDATVSPRSIAAWEWHDEGRVVPVTIDGLVMTTVGEQHMLARALAGDEIELLARVHAPSGPPADDLGLRGLDALVAENARRALSETILDELCIGKAPAGVDPRDHARVCSAALKSVGGGAWAAHIDATLK